jgi:uncharacterized protein (DUF1501 family)
MYEAIRNPQSAIQNGLSRRDWLRLCTAGALTAPTSGWLSTLAAHASESGKPRKKSCILLFMTGGASHIDTFDPKPNNDTSEFRPISTNVSGIQICENLPKMADQMDKCALLRGMSTSEGSHGRARYYMHTGYRQGVGGVTHPSLGSIASARLTRPESDLPNFVCIGGAAFGAGYIGPQHAPVEIADPMRGIENLKPTGSMTAFDKKASLLEEIERGFLERVPAAAADAHQKTYRRAIDLMHSAKAKAFDLEQEPASARDLYGRSRLGNACLMARRLVEHDVAFVEIPMNGWDTHRDNTGRVQTLCGELDRPMAALIADLKDRGLLDSTLVIWMGDFGRTPKIGKQGGRDHYPRAWTTLLAGAGIKPGQVIGGTDAQGSTVVERPTSAIDFMATVCRALDIDHTKEFRTKDGRPIRVVDKGEKVVTELF